MPTVRRRIMFLLSAASLTLCVASCVCWAASLLRSDRVGLAGWRGPGDWHGCGLATYRNGVLFYYFSGTFRLIDPSSVEGSDDAINRPQGFWKSQHAQSLVVPRGGGLLQRAGFRAEAIPFGAASGRWSLVRILTVPYWALILLFAPLPIWTWRTAIATSWRRYRAWRRGGCRACGARLPDPPADCCPTCGALQVARGFDCPVAPDR